MGINCCYFSECLCSYIFTEHYYQGNKIFKNINVDLNTGNNNLTPEEQTILHNCVISLQEMEGTRLKIANKFQSFLFHTGACVLTQPTMERGLSTYIVFLITQILICVKETNQIFNLEDFSLSKFIAFTMEKPYININQENLDNLKNKYRFDFNKFDKLIKGKDSIIEFLSTVSEAKNIFEKQIDLIKNFEKKDFKNIFMLNEIRKTLDGLKFILDFFSEIASGILETESKLTIPWKYKLFFNIAKKAADKKIDNPREIAMIYAIGDNCGIIEKWKENMTFKEIEPSKY